MAQILPFTKFGGIAVICIMWMPLYQALGQDIPGSDPLIYSQPYGGFTNPSNVQYAYPISKRWAEMKIATLPLNNSFRPLYYITTNVNAISTVRADALAEITGTISQLTGNGIIVGLWDVGVPLGSHQEIFMRIEVMDGASVLSDHATHIAGTMGGTGIISLAAGFAPDVSIEAYDWDDDLSELDVAANDGLTISVHPYTFIAGWQNNWFGENQWAWFGDLSVSQEEDWLFGFYMKESEQIDSIIYHNQNLISITAAGNDRIDNGPSQNEIGLLQDGTSLLLYPPADGPFDSMPGGIGVAKNVITVGAVEDILPADRDTPLVSIAGFSSWGPTDDGRLKPDLVANGVDLYSAMAASDAAYGSNSGTSSAAASLGGVVALLSQQYGEYYGVEPTAAIMKAILIHTTDEAGPAAGPDYKFGWGLVNTLRAAQLIEQDNLVSRTIMEFNLYEGDEIRISVSSEGVLPLKCTIVWSDPPGPVSQPSLDPSDPKLVNDLDMTLIHMDTGQTYWPWTLDPANPNQAAVSGNNNRDNVEQVVLQAPDAGNYEIVIRHKGLLEDGHQNFAIVTTGVQFPDPIITLVWDGDLEGIDYSGSFISQALSATGLHDITYTDILPANLGGYDLVMMSFGNLGRFADNTPFTQAMAESVSNYLLEGGRLYFEGGDALGENQAGNTDLFGLLGISDVNGGYLNPIDTLFGLPGSLADGMIFPGSDQVSSNYIDWFYVGDGSAVFSESGYDGPVAVQYSGDSGQRTMVFSYRLDGLMPGEGNSNKSALLDSIVSFLLYQPTIPEIPPDTIIVPPDTTVVSVPTISSVTPTHIVRGSLTTVEIAGENLNVFDDIFAQPAIIESVEFVDGELILLTVNPVIDEPSDTLVIQLVALGETTMISIPIVSRPQALGDTLFTTEDLAIEGSILTNDYWPDEVGLSILRGPLYGEAVIQSINNLLYYAPQNNYYGLDSLTYELLGAEGLTDTATVTIIIEPVNDAPTAPILMSPANGSSVDTSRANLSSVYLFRWMRSYDVDGDDIAYIFVLDSLANRSIPAVALTDTQWVHNTNDLLALWDSTGMQGPLTIYWNVFSTDGQDTIRSLNGPFALVIQGSWLSVERENSVPDKIVLHPNYPNPFNPTTTIRFDLPEAANVKVTILDLTGRPKRILINGDMPAGYHSVVWNGRDSYGRKLPSGVYFAIMVTPRHTSCIKLIQIK